MECDINKGYGTWNAGRERIPSVRQKLPVYIFVHRSEYKLERTESMTRVYARYTETW